MSAEPNALLEYIEEQEERNANVKAILDRLPPVWDEDPRLVPFVTAGFELMNA